MSVLKSSIVRLKCIGNDHDDLGEDGFAVVGKDSLDRMGRAAIDSSDQIHLTLAIG